MLLKGLMDWIGSQNLLLFNVFIFAVSNASSVNEKVVGTISWLKRQENSVRRQSFCFE